MTERTSKRWWKRPVTLVAGGVLLLVLLLAGAEIWIGIKIRRTIEREAAALTGGICRVEVRHARFNLFNRSVRLRGITLSTDSTALAAKGTPLESLRIELEQLFVKGIRWKNSGGDRSLSLGELTLQSPVVRLVRNSDYRRPDQDSTAPKSKKRPRTTGRIRRSNSHRSLCTDRRDVRLLRTQERQAALPRYRWHYAPNRPPRPRRFVQRSGA